MIQDLTYELSVLAKVVQHKNLSAASAHVGLSQPQLSRLVQKIESELKIILLDRTARRKSGWTETAILLATAYSKNINRLEAEITAIAQERDISELRIGTLEGLSTMASQFSKDAFSKLKMKIIYLDVLDFKDLDSQFLGGNLDLIFTVKPPGKQKFNHLLEVGYQNMEKINTNKETLVCSPFEFTGMEKKFEGTTALVSNSLLIRNHWLKNIGGNGVLPTETKQGRGKGFHTVYLVGSDLLSPKIWESITDLF